MPDVIANMIPAAVTLPAHISANTYFSTLHSLITGVEITTGSGTRLQLEDGIGQALEMIAHVKKTARKIMLIGNGGSAAIASHEALDFWKAGGVQSLAFNDFAQLTCLGNDFGYEHIFSKAIDTFAQSGDMLIAISSSGKSANILNGVTAARKKQCSVMTFAGFAPDTPLRSLGDLNFYIGSNSYGHVEVAHLSLIHYLTDITAMQNRGMCK